MAADYDGTSDFRGASFTGADFTGASFRDCDLSQVKVTDSWLVDVRVSGLVENRRYAVRDLAALEADQGLSPQESKKAQGRSTRCFSNTRGAALCLIKVCPAVSYSPAGPPLQYHRR